MYPKVVMKTGDKYWTDYNLGKKHVVQLGPPQNSCGALKAFEVVCLFLGFFFLSFASFFI